MTDPIGLISEFADYVEWPNAKSDSAAVPWAQALEDRLVYRSGDT
jgi:hypothetical protein